MRIKRILSLLLCLAAAAGLLAACGSSAPEASETTVAAEETIPPLGKTAVQSQDPRYVPIEDVGAYDPEIITPELLSGTTLTDLDKSDLPYWSGYILENKIFAAQEYSYAWERHNAGGAYFCEDEIRYLSENGFNCVRVLYSFSILSNPDDIYSINISELEQLDELISWCAKYNIHMMISITGLPGIHGTDIHAEDPAHTPILFTDSAVEEAFVRYWDMLSKRYAEIPNGLLSFELLAEPCGVGDDGTDPDAMIQRYCEVLEPVALSMFEDRPDRIVLAMDICKLVPERLAEIGCCLSLHNHIYAINSENIQTQYGIDVEKTNWPIPLIPSNLYDGQEIVLQCQEEEGFQGTRLFLRYDYFNREPELYADGVLLPWENATGQYLGFESGELKIHIPDGTRELRIVTREEFGPSLIYLYRNEKYMAITSYYIEGEQIDFTPTFVITAGDDILCADEATASFGDWEDMYKTSIGLFADCAKKHGVSFVMSEVGSDTQSLSPEEYIAYHEQWISVLKEHGIGWTYNCVHNILGPRYLIWHNGMNGHIPFENFSDWGDHGYNVNDDIMNLLKKYQ